MFPLVLNHFLPRTLAMRAALGAAVVVLVPLAAAIYDWRQVAAARLLAHDVASAAASAAAIHFDDASRATRRVLDEMAPQRFTLETSIGVMDAKSTPPAFKAGDAEANVVRVTASGNARLTIGRWLGFGSWPVSATAMAERTGLAAIVVRGNAIPGLVGLTQTVERQLAGDAWVFSADDRKALAATNLDLRAMVMALREHYPQAADRFAETWVPINELFAIAAALIDTTDRLPEQDARAAVSLSHLAQLTASDLDIALGSVFGFTAGFDPVTTNLPPKALEIRAIDLVQSVMRARLIDHPVSVAIDKPAAGIEDLRLEVEAQSSEDNGAASVMIGANDSVIRTLPIRVGAQVRLGGISIGSVHDFVLPLEVMVSAGDAQIASIVCTGPYSNVEVRGRPVRAVASVFRPETETKAAASGFVPILTTSGLMVWAKGSAAFANDPPISQIIPATSSGSELFRLHAPIDLGNRLAKLANEASIVISADAASGMSEGAIRADITQAIKDRLDVLTEVFQSAYAAFGITPGELEVAVSAASCAYSRPVQ